MGNFTHSQTPFCPSIILYVSIISPLYCLLLYHTWVTRKHYSTSLAFWLAYEFLYILFLCDVIFVESTNAVSFLERVVSKYKNELLFVESVQSLI